MNAIRTLLPSALIAAAALLAACGSSAYDLPDTGQDGGDADCELSTVYFEANSVEVSFEELQRLKAMARCIKAGTREVEIEGHTDLKGDPSYKMVVAQRRATNVREILIEQGIAPVRLTAKSYGKERPACEPGPTDSPQRTEACQAKNRRVELHFR